ncbi:exonuclease SbcCD subunit D [Oceanotoga sp. DSM 15011]|jgi:exonuclease SbcD|uniref:exonuclease SbcCD subunit D n=1 Tax=Oceanotoga sp. DSM 15011 TaxID=2984951 RepID=UPI0021F47D9C|nr:exonuclease SbcCD subunit D [Oceanotoga sp. DSM 15011]UYP00595.1 exonuclease SbcCD subunit D [Oceanotoga sp. DSM 15011]
MKIIHTADWHLGKIIYSNYMTQEQEYILEQFINYVEKNKPDVIIISGDIYDRSIPPSEAVNLLNKVLSNIVIKNKIPTMIISGNHDSEERLEFLNGILSEMDLHIEGKIKKQIKKVIINKNSKDKTNFYLLPYIEMQKVKDLYEIDFQTKNEAMKYIIKEMKIDTNEINILISHEYVAGGIESDSERILSIGGTEYIDPQILKDFDYVALGHLHGPQKIKYEKIRYSGSLMKYSFSETNQKKGMNLIEINQKNDIKIKQINFKPKRDMKIIKGLFNEIIKMENTDDYLHIIIEDQEPIYEAINKLRTKYPNVLSLEFPNLKTNNDIKTNKKNIKNISPNELFYYFYEEIKGKKINENQKTYTNKLFEEILKERSEE